LEERLYVQAFVKEIEFKNILKELNEGRIAGYDASHKVFSAGNPDRCIVNLKVGEGVKS